MGCAQLPRHMFSMDIVATQHAVLGMSIHHDLATERSCCNGLTVALDRLRTLHVKEECVSVKPFRRVVWAAPMPHVKHGYRCHTPCGARDISILPGLATVRPCCNGLTVTLEPSCERCQGESGSAKSSQQVVRDSPAICLAWISLSHTMRC